MEYKRLLMAWRACKGTNMDFISYLHTVSVFLHVFTDTSLQTLYSFSARSPLYWHLPATLRSHGGFIKQFPLTEKKKNQSIRGGFQEEEKIK